MLSARHISHAWPLSPIPVYAASVPWQAPVILVNRGALYGRLRPSKLLFSQHACLVRWAGPYGLLQCSGVHAKLGPEVSTSHKAMLILAASSVLLLVIPLLSSTSSLFLEIPNRQA
jgi:hypothetical protein